MYYYDPEIIRYAAFNAKLKIENRLIWLNRTNTEKNANDDHAYINRNKVHANIMHHEINQYII
jgi:hypothetical protein